MNSFFGSLTILFVGLKLTGFLADWSWWWVLSPVWAPVVILSAIVVGAWGIVAILEAFETKEQRAAREFSEASQRLIKSLRRR